eukprot:RCo041010
MGSLFSKRKSRPPSDADTRRKAKKRAAVSAWLSVVQPDLSLPPAPSLTGRPSRRSSAFSTFPSTDSLRSHRAREGHSLPPAAPSECTLVSSSGESSVLRRPPGERVHPLVVCPDLLEELARCSCRTPEIPSEISKVRTVTTVDVECPTPRSGGRHGSQASHMMPFHTPSTNSQSPSPSAPGSSPRDMSLVCTGNPLTPRSAVSMRSVESAGRHSSGPGD